MYLFFLSNRWVYDHLLDDLVYYKSGVIFISDSGWSLVGEDVPIYGCLLKKVQIAVSFTVASGCRGRFSKSC